MQTNSFFKTAAFSLMLSAFSLSQIQAQTTANWIGPASGGEWNTPTSWDTGAPPLDNTTNAVIGAGTNVSYNLPMTATGFGSLTDNGVVNVNTNGFNCASVLMIYPAGTGKIFINTGGGMNVTGNLGFCSNSVVSLSAGGSLTVGGGLNIGSDLTGGSTGTATVGAFGSMTNYGGTLTAASVALNSRNASIGTSCRLIIMGGTNNLGAFSAQRSPGGNNAPSALGTDGLVISNGFVNTTSISIGNNAHGIMFQTGGVVTNAGTLTVKNSTVTRPARFLQVGGLFVTTDPSVAVINPSGTGDTVYSVLGGTNVVGGLSFGSAANTGVVYFTNAAPIYVGSQGITYNGSVTLNAILNNGGMFGATAPWTGAAAMKLNGGTFTFQAADLGGNSNNITLTAPLSGTGALTKTGNGILALNAVNTYSGITTVNAGTLALGSGASLASSSIFLNNGTTFDVSQVGGFTLNSGQTLAGSGVVTGVVSAATSSTIYPGNNSVTGTLAFQNDVSESGGVINELNLSSNPTGPNNDFITVAGALNLSGVNTFLINGQVVSGGVYPLIQYGSISGDTNNFVVSGATGILSNSTVSKTIYFIPQTTTRGATNLTWVGDGMANNWDISTSNWVHGATMFTFQAGDSVVFDNTGSTNPIVTIAALVAPASVTVNSTSNYTFAGTAYGITGSTGLIKTNSGTLTIATTNNYTGPTVVGGGVLEVLNIANSGLASAIGSAVNSPTNLILFGGSALRYSGDNASTDRGLTLNNGVTTLEVTNSSKTLTLNGTVTGAGTLVKYGPGTLTFGTGNSYSGGTVISNGVLATANDTANTTGFGSTNNPITLYGGTLALYRNNGDDGSTVYSFYNPVVVPAGQTAGLTVFERGNFNGSLTGAGTVNLTTAGQRAGFAGNWSGFTGTVNITGNFRIANTNGYSNAVISLNDGADLDGGTSGGTYQTNPTFDIGELDGTSLSTIGAASKPTPNPTWRIGWKNTTSFFAGRIENPAGGASSIVKVGTGTLILNAGTTPSVGLDENFNIITNYIYANQITYTGSTTISNGVLALLAPATLTNSSPIILASSTAILDASQMGYPDTTGTNLIVTGAFELISGQNLSGVGTIRGSLITDAGSVFNIGLPGSAGILTATNSITLGGTTVMKLNRNASPNSDRLISSVGVVNYGGTLLVSNIGSGLHVGDSFTLFGGTTLNNSSFSNVVLPNYYVWDTSQLSTLGKISVTSVSPLPSISSVDYSQLANNSLTLYASNGAPNGGFAILNTTNIALPLSQWTTVATGNFDGSGNINGSSGQQITVDSTQPQEYYVIKAY